MLSNMTIYHALIIGIALLTGCSGSNPDPAPLEKNIYANGFRLSKATNTFGSRVIVRNYEYNFSNNEILIKKSTVGEDDAPDISKLNIDRSGRLVGGSFNFEPTGPIGGFTSEYDFLYDEEGRVIEYSNSPDNVSTFNYVDGLLDNVAYRILNTTYTHRFTYDAQGVRTSSQNGISLASTQFEYNTLGQLSGAIGINSAGRQFMMYELEYDANGNHISTITKFIDGDVLTTDVYTYEASPETVFNHGILRQKIEAFEVTSARYVR